jgi:hypothetical protein
VGEWVGGWVGVQPSCIIPVMATMRAS